MFDQEYVIIMDTNVILNLYKFTPETISSLIDVFKENTEDFLILNQVYREYIRNIDKIREEEINRYLNLKEELCKKIDDTVGQVKKTFATYNKYLIPEVSDIQNELLQSLSELQKANKQTLDKIGNNHKQQSQCISKENDIVLGFVEQVRENRIQKEFTTLELMKIYEEGEIRYKYKIAPGFTDKNKSEKDKSGKDKGLSSSEQRKYGDLVIWKEILRFIKGKKINLIFLQNERKSDWFESGKIAKVLLEEFEENTELGSQFFMMSFEKFIEEAQKFYSIPMNAYAEVQKKSKELKEYQQYIQDNKVKLCHKIIDQKSEEVMEEIQSALLYKDVGLGMISELQDLEILNQTPIVKDYSFDFNSGQIIIDTIVDLEVEGNATIDVSRDWQEYYRVTATVQLDMELGLIIQKDKDIKTIYDFLDIHKSNLINLDYIFETDYDDFEEDEIDMESLDICPDCGKHVSSDFMGGNGFCINCASEH